MSRQRNLKTVVSVLNLNPRKFGSMEEYMALLARGLKERNWQGVFVLPEQASPEVMRHFEDTDAAFVVVPEIGNGRGYWSLWRTLRSCPGPVVHFHFCPFFSLYPVIAWLGGASLIVFTQHARLSERPSRSRALKGWLWDRLILRPTGTKILTVAAHLRDRLIDSYRLSGTNIQVLYNGVNLCRFRTTRDGEDATRLRAELGIQASNRIVLAAAYLVPGKGIANLVAAAQTVLGEHADTVFVIVGDGPELEALRKQARDLGIANAVRFPGLRSDVESFMAMADVVVFPSVYRESAPLVAMEAMASGRPVVATRVGGLVEVVDDDVTGILVDPSSPAQLAAAVLRLLTQHGLASAMGKAGRERAEMNFSADRWIGDTVSYYEQHLP